MAELQTMESAPKDGTHILAYVTTKGRNRGWMVIFWTGHYWTSYPGRYGCEPLHWMALPDSPFSK